MTERIKMMLDRQHNTQYPICTERGEIMVPVLLESAGDPIIIQRAKAVAAYLEKRTIFIQDGELIIGNLAKEPMGMESDPYSPTWPKDDLEDLLGGYQLIMSDEAKEKLSLIDTFAKDKGRTRAERRGRYYNDERLWPFIQHGFLSPGWKSKTVGRGYGMAGAGWGFPSVMLMTPDFGKIIATGFEAKIKEVEEAQRNLKFLEKNDIYKADFYEAALILLKAMIKQSQRYAALAREMAEKEENAVRKQELLDIAQVCDNIPAKPAKTFREAIQAFYFFWCYALNGTMAGARFDEYMGPYYEADLAAGRITRDEALELIECLRIKIMEYNSVGGGKAQREKWAGMARWHNFIIGGYDKNGKEVTNEVSYMMLDAAIETRTPHPTISVRVCKDTPKELMQRGLECVKSGLGMPAFVSDGSYTNFLVRNGVDIENAREWAISGCLDINIPGRSRINAFGMFIVPMVLELAIYNGRGPKEDYLFGKETGYLYDYKSYDEFYKAFLEQLEICVGFVNEEHNIAVTVDGDNNSDALVSVFCDKGVEYGRDISSRPMLFENGSVCNMVGVVSVIDSLAAVKKLVFEEKKITSKQLFDALKANWEGYEDIQKLCRNAPKFGNNDPFVDQIAKQVWADYARIVKKFKTAFGGTFLPTATSITAHGPGGATTGATPDGRYSGETLPDGTISPAQGRDKSGPLAVLQSGMAIDQDDYLATLLNMKFSPNTLKTDSDLEKLGAMIRTYLTNGGKHVQFNVVDGAELSAAQADPKAHSDLIVRVAGYSAYFTVLQKRIQDEIIERTAHEL